MTADITIQSTPGYVAAIAYRPDPAACPACGADLEET